MESKREEIADETPDETPELLLGQSCLCGVEDREHGFGPRCIGWPHDCPCGQTAYSSGLETAGGIKSYQVSCRLEKCWAGPEEATIADAVRAWNTVVTRIPPTESARRCADWQPIETAPKNGTNFLAVVPDPDDGELMVRIVGWHKTSHVPMYGFCLVDQGAEECDFCKPTLWMPLPAAPNVRTADRDSGEEK